jgi:vitamin K-dependent gamma-carboxylase-like protein
VPVNRLIGLWNAYWFPTTSTLNLAGARIVAAGVEVFWLFPSLPYQINLLTKNPAFMYPQPLIRAIDAVVPHDLVFSAAGFTVIYWVSIVAGLAALVGFATRTSLFLLTFGLWFFVSHAYSYADVHHTQAPFAIFLLALAFSPAGDSLSIDALIRRRRARAAGEQALIARSTDVAMWPLKLAHVFLAMTYFSTGITKLLSGGLAWMNGYTLQTYIFRDGINRGIPAGIWLAHQHTLCVLLAIGTILFEVSYFVSILVPRVAPLFFVGGILFHIGLYVISGHPFFEHIVLNAILLLFLDPEWFPAQVRKLTARRTEHEPAIRAA